MGALETTRLRAPTELKVLHWYSDVVQSPPTCSLPDRYYGQVVIEVIEKRLMTSMGLYYVLHNLYRASVHFHHCYGR